MIKVGFLLNFSVEYKGGINYIKNLFFAIHKYHKDTIKVVLFIPKNLPVEYIELFKDYAEIVPTNILQRKTTSWFCAKVMERLFNFDFITYNLLKRYQIQIISHSNYIPFKNDIKSLNWIPDFQYLHYPNLWSAKQLKMEQRLHSNWIAKSNGIVVSSYDALEDLLSIYPEAKSKVSVLHFVSQPDILKGGQEYDISKYSSGRFFYLPNQFWEHKNHIVVFEAIKQLKDRGHNLKLLTSGLMNDFRNKNHHVQMLKDFITKNNLENNISFLGLIPYADVLQLIKKSVAVINPSFFEGWSSTVEESKSIGKTVVLSNIGVHKEQAPDAGVYFDPTDATQLAQVLEEVWTGPEGFQKSDIALQAELDQRTKAFADNYKLIISRL